MRPFDYLKTYIAGELKKDEEVMKLKDVITLVNNLLRCGNLKKYLEAEYGTNEPGNRYKSFDSDFEGSNRLK